MPINPISRLLVPVLALTLAACASDPVAPRIEETRFAPELGVDLNAMTKSSSGLYVQNLEVGEGAEAEVGSTVYIRYTAWLANGFQFDTNTGSGDALVSFMIGATNVIRGVDEGVFGMRVGGRRRLIIPPSLGYGSRSYGPIPGNSILVFDVELVAIHGTPAPTIEETQFAPELGVDLAAMTKTATGLYVQDVVEGGGAEAGDGSQVDIRYTGWLADGFQFDTNTEPGDPIFTFTIGAGGVIVGMAEGVDGMRVGGKRRLILPPNLGYGSQPLGPIPPNAILVFDVELVDLE